MSPCSEHGAIRVDTVKDQVSGGVWISGHNIQLLDRGVQSTHCNRMEEANAPDDLQGIAPN